MKKFELGRTLIETLAVIAIIGILSVSGLQLYSKAMNTIRANYIMEQVYIKANELIENPVANRPGRGKMVDVTMNSEGSLSYGYTIDMSNTKMSGSEIAVKLNGYFPTGVCKILRKKITSQEYSGLKGIQPNNCSDNIESMTFIIDSEFKKQESE